MINIQSIQQLHCSRVSKPPFQMGVSNCLLYDGFFSFAVVRQINIRKSG